MIKVFNFDNDINLSCNTYIVGKKGGNCILVDLGSLDKTIYEFIDKNFKHVDAILLTHAHLDHIRGVNNFIKRYKDCQVYLHEEDYEMLVNPIYNKEIFNQEIDINFDPILVKDNDTLNLGDIKIQVIHTPYHTKGSVCYLLKEENALFTGDSLFKGSIGRSDFSNSEPDKIASSLHKIFALNEMLVCYPGHGQITNIKQELLTNPYIRG